MNKLLTDIYSGFEPEVTTELIAVLRQKRRYQQQIEEESCTPLVPSTELINRVKCLGFICKPKPNLFFKAVTSQLQPTLYKNFSYKELIKIAVQRVAYGFESAKCVRNSLIRNETHIGDGINNLLISALASALKISIVIIRCDAALPKVFRNKQSIKTIYLGYDKSSQRYYLLDRPIGQIAVA